MLERWFSLRRFWAGRLLEAGGPCAQPGIRFADPSDAVTAGTVAVQHLRDCAILCWNSPRFDLRSGTPIVVERLCCTLSGCRIFPPHFSFLWI